MTQGNAYDYRAIKGFAISSLFWGIVGLLIGILISFQLVYPQLNITSWLTYGRLRPLHTNALIYGFTLPAAFSLFFYLVQRLGRTTLAFPGLAKVLRRRCRSMVARQHDQRGLQTDPAIHHT